MTVCSPPLAGRPAHVFAVRVPERLRVLRGDRHRSRAPAAQGNRLSLRSLQQDQKDCSLRLRRHP